MDVTLRLVCGEAIGDGEEGLAHRGQMIEPFFEPGVCEIVGAELVSEEGAELFVLPGESVLEIDAEDVMAMLDLFERRVELPFELLGKDLGDLLAVISQRLEDFIFMNREIPFKNELPAEFNLLNGVEAPQFHGLSLASENLGRGPGSNIRADCR
jgi:hypothetical protein